MVGARRAHLTPLPPGAQARLDSTMFGFLRRKPKPVSEDTAAQPAQGPQAEPAAPTLLADAIAPAPGSLAGDGQTLSAPAPEPPPAPQPPSPPPAAAELQFAPQPLQPERAPWMARLRQGMSRTRSNIAGVFGVTNIDESLYEDLETALLASDCGVAATAYLLDGLRARVRSQRLREPAQLPAALRAEVAALLAPLEKPIDIDRAVPLVMMIAGVNGAGKTTSIGKLAHHLQREGKSILLAAGDTFRAAAREQLAEWGARNNVQVISQQGGDPGAVAFDAVAAGRARKLGVVMVDTAGRLPTQTHLMDELKKIRRVIAKAMPDAPHEVLLVLDGNTGQNMLSQVKAFDEAVALTGLIVTKLDGTAKGGALVALAHARRSNPVPVYFVGVGEGIDDLQAFSAIEFASALVD